MTRIRNERKMSEIILPISPSLSHSLPPSLSLSLSISVSRFYSLPITLSLSLPFSSSFSLSLSLLFHSRLLSPYHTFPRPLSLSLCLYVCVCVCVRAWGRERESERCFWDRKSAKRFAKVSNKEKRRLWEENSLFHLFSQDYFFFAAKCQVNSNNVWHFFGTFLTHLCVI